MQAVVIACSQKFENIELIERTLRSVYEKYGRIELRFADPATGTAKLAREYAEYLGFSVERYKSGSSERYASEIKASEMIRGYKINLDTCEQYDTKAPADLVLAFWRGTKDTCSQIFERQLFVGRGKKPVVVYREKNGKLHRATNDPRKRWKLGEWVATEAKSST